MSPEQISLMKTLCALRWIALLHGNAALAKTIQNNMDYLESPPC